MQPSRGEVVTNSLSGQSSPYDISETVNQLSLAVKVLSDRVAMLEANSRTYRGFYKGGNT